jgi:hypothetical protein
MSDTGVQATAEGTPQLSQMERVVDVFTAPSKTFTDIKNGHRSWWVPFLILLLTGAICWFSIYKQVTWKQVFDNQQRVMPEFAKRMMENMTPEQKAAQEQKGPINQAVTWAISPLGLLLINLVASLVLWPTINFGFGGKATLGKIFAVTMYAGLVLWPIKLLIASIALWVGASPEAFDPNNVAGTNYGYFMEQHTGVAYTLARMFDPLEFWNLILTGLGLSIVAGVKRASGYVVVFGWWALIMLVFIGLAAAFS